MVNDINAFKNSINRKKGLMDRLGDAGRFLKALFDKGELSEAAIKKTIGELEQYSATCFDQIDDMGNQWHKAYQQIKELKQKMAAASPPVKNTLMAKADVLVRRYDGFHGRSNKLKRNGIAAQVLIEKLHDALILRTGPMTENSIDEWTTTLDEAIGEREMSDRALRELENTDEKEETIERKTSIKETENQIGKIISGEDKSDEERSIEKRLEEF